MSSICIGILLGTLVSISIKAAMPHDSFLDYGWRIPFLIGIFVMLAGFYISKYTKETPLFKDLKQKGVLVSSPLSYVFKNHWRDMLISVMINSTGSVIFYFQAVYIANYLKINRDFLDIEVDKISTICYILMAFSTVLSGFISDLIGRKRLYFLIIIFAVFSISTITGIIQFGNWLEVIIAQLVLALIASFYIGPEPALQAELYPTKVRATALSVSYNFSTSLFGGTTPYIISYLYYSTESLSGCAGYIIIVSIISLIGLYFYNPKEVSEADSTKLI